MNNIQSSVLNIEMSDVQSLIYVSIRNEYEHEENSYIFGRVYRSKTPISLVGI